MIDALSAIEDLRRIKTNCYPNMDKKDASRMWSELKQKINSVMENQPAKFGDVLAKIKKAVGHG